jgi:surfactin synthase thioesterase subunit
MKVNLEKDTQLFLLHFAGGNIYSFNFLKKSISSNIEFIALELPGRGKRHNEKLLKNKSEAIEDYVKQIKSLRNGKPFLIFGHSMGATLGLSITDRLEALGDEPYGLIVSGNAGPGMKKEDKIKRYLLNDIDFKEELKKLGGISQDILEHKEFYDFFSPVMRADFETLEQDDFIEKNIRLKTPIYALMGSEEKTVDKIENWKNFTRGTFQYKILSGNHFFIHEHPQEVADIIVKHF